MRYVPVSKIQDGMILGRPFYGSKFEILLAEGMTLSRLHIDRINELGYAGVYIIDDSTSDVLIKDIIPASLRLSTIKAAKEFVENAEIAASQTVSRIKQPKISQERQKKIILPIIDEIIDSKRRLTDIIDLKPYDYYNYYHASNCVVLSLLIGIELGLSGNQLYELGMSSLLHDIGNTFIPKSILEKPDKLTDEEYKVIKSHTELGFEYLKENYDITIEACVGALHHHENYDGTGYPNGLKKNKISIYGRIIGVTDVYDALVSRRPFREAMYPPQALEIIHKRSGTAFDPEILAALDKVVSRYPVGINVTLDTGVECLVVENFASDPSRPKLRLLNNMSSSKFYVDLQHDPVFVKNQITKINT